VQSFFIRRVSSRLLIYKILGYLLLLLALVHVSAALVSLLYRENSMWTFIGSSLLTAICGYLLVYAGRGAEQLKSRQLFLLTTLSWLVICIFSALPFWLIIPDSSFTNAWFETVSGITTTGSTVYSGLDNMPKGILYWRAVLNWIGGIGIIVMALAILPALKIGGMRLFKIESSDTSEKILPKSSSMSAAIGGVYLVLSVVTAITYYLCGMSGFDAITHMMATVATGGFANYDASFGVYKEMPHIYWFTSLFMLLAAMPFVLLISFASEDYTLWGNLAVMLFFYITFAGACSGSTSGGLKIFRIQLSAMLLIKQLKLLIHPKAVWSQKYGSKTVDDQLLGNVLAFCFIYFASIGFIALMLSFYELDLVTALTGAATAVASVGPGLGSIIGPAGNFASLPDGAKWWLSLGMLSGRLEILTLLVLFTPAYWRF